MKRKLLKSIWIFMLAFCLCLAVGCGGDGQQDAPPPAEIVSGQTDDGEQAADDALAAEDKEGAPEAQEEAGAYSTDPVPAGKPAPVEPQAAEVKKDETLHCTVSIVCSTISDNLEDLAEGKEAILPEDGVLLSETEVEFYEGENAFDVLQRTCKDNKLHMEFVSTPIYNSSYIEGIGNIYEFDCGPLSGWMYKVNDWFPNYGCSRYALEDGDAVQWIYTCDLGRDIGGDLNEQRE